MKKTLILLGLISIYSCSPDTYTSSRYFNCPKNKEFNPGTDKQKLIVEILTRSVVDLKDLVDYDLLKDKNNIYINRTYFSKFSGATKADIQEYQFEDSEVPARIKDVNFCLKSREGLQKIADKTTEFVFLTFSDIEIKGDVATIAIATWWQPQSPPKQKYHLSGGGYKLQYKKVDGNWVFDKSLVSWQS